MTEAPNPRELVLDILLETEKEENLSHLVIRQMLQKYQYMTKQDRAFITRLAEGTLENRLYIDTIISEYSKTPLNKLKPLIRNLLRMGIYQILWMDRVPDSAACNEAVKLASKRGFYQLKGYVNGVLRHIVRDKEQLLPEQLREKYADDPDKYLSLRYSIPQWIIKDWQKVYSYDIIEKIAQAMLETDATAVRFQTDKVSKDTIIHSLQSEGCQVMPCDAAEELFYIKGYDYLDGLYAFSQGWIIVQDLSSVLAGLTAAPQRENFVLDVCAAPGGKSIHMAYLMQNSGMVEARDISESKVAYIEENIQRMHMENIRTRVWDATVTDTAMLGKADIVLADVPCSGLGVMGNKTDIKYRMTKEKQMELVSLQKRILKTVVPYLKQGGYLVYSTCTINRQENEEIFEWLVREFGLKPVDISGVFKKLPACETASRGYQQLLPGIHGTAGFFISKLQKC